MLISLLQPPPETVANFDEMIIISEGRIIYAGPVDEVIDHFCSLGYKIPERMDVADWLQVRIDQSPFWLAIVRCINSQFWCLFCQKGSCDQRWLGISRGQHQ